MIKKKQYNKIKQQGEFMKSIDYNSMKNVLKIIVCKIFNGYKKEYGAKNICGFGIYSDESAMTMCVALNRYDYFKNVIKNDSENECDYKFNPEEWEVIVEDEELDTFNKTLEEVSFKIREKQFVEHRDHIYKLALEILDEMKQEKYFHDFQNDFVLLFSLSDFEFTETVIEYNKKFNSKKVSDEYEKWINEMDEWDEDEDEE